MSKQGCGWFIILCGAYIYINYIIVEFSGKGGNDSVPDVDTFSEKTSGLDWEATVVVVSLICFASAILGFIKILVVRFREVPQSRTSKFADSGKNRLVRDAARTVSSKAGEPEQIGNVRLSDSADEFSWEEAPRMKAGEFDDSRGGEGQKLRFSMYQRPIKFGQAPKATDSSAFVPTGKVEEKSPLPVPAKPFPRERPARQREVPKKRTCLKSERTRLKDI